MGLYLQLGCTDRTIQDPKQHALELHDRILTIDTHTDTPLRLFRKGWDIGELHESGLSASGKIDLPRMKAGGLDAAFFAAFEGQKERTPDGFKNTKLRADKTITAIWDIQTRYPDLAEIALTPDDACRIQKAGKRTIFIGMENVYPIGKDLSNIGYFYERGVRYITLCHTKNNDICDSSTDKKGSEWNGLSPFGERVVDEMNRLGILIDVSHMSDEAFFDVLERSKTPVFASHSNCRAVFDDDRNITDDMLRVLAKNGGVIHINLCSFYIKDIEKNPQKKKELADLRKQYDGGYYYIEDEARKAEYLEVYYAIQDKYPSEKATVSEMVDHIDHAVKIAGIDHVGIGSDFDGGAELEDVRDVSEMPNITIELVKRGYTDAEIEKIWSGNFLRVFREAIQCAEEKK